MIRWVLLILLVLPAFAQQNLINPYRYGAAASTLNNGIVAYWKLNEASAANRADSVGSITLTNPVGLTIEGVSGKLSNAAEFDQADGDHLFSAADPAAVDFTGNQDFTVACWVQIKAGTLNQRRTFVAKYESAGQAQWYLQARNSPSARLLFGVNDAEIEAIANNYGVPAEDTWIFMVCWHDATADTVNIQINNGTADSTAHSAGIEDSTSIVRVGRLTTAGYLDGMVDEIGVWNRVLTSGERTELYNSGTGKTYPF